MRAKGKPIVYRNIDTGELFTLEEIREGYEMFRGEMEYDSFEEYLDYLTELGTSRVGGLTRYLPS